MNVYSPYTLAIQYNTIVQTVHQRQRQNLGQALNSQKTPHTSPPWGVSFFYGVREKLPRYIENAIYNGECQMIPGNSYEKHIVSHHGLYKIMFILTAMKEHLPWVTVKFSGRFTVYCSVYRCLFKFIKLWLWWWLWRHSWRQNITRTLNSQNTSHISLGCLLWKLRRILIAL